MWVISIALHAPQIITVMVYQHRFQWILFYAINFISYLIYSNYRQANDRLIGIFFKLYFVGINLLLYINSKCIAITWIVTHRIHLVKCEINFNKTVFRASFLVETLTILFGYSPFGKLPINCFFDLKFNLKIRSWWEFLYFYFREN